MATRCPIDRLVELVASSPLLAVMLRDSNADANDAALQIASHAASAAWLEAEDGEWVSQLAVGTLQQPPDSMRQCRSMCRLIEFLQLDNCNVLLNCVLVRISKNCEYEILDGLQRAALCSDGSIRESVKQRVAAVGTERCCACATPA